MNRFILWFTKITGAPINWFYFRKKVYYINKKSQSRKIKGKAIIISNHTSVYDVALYMFVFIRRNIHVLVAEIIYQKGKLFTWFLNKIGGIKVDRVSYDFGFMTESIDILNKGGVIEIYPEGRLPRNDEKELLPFKPSFVYIALESEAPIIPVYTNGQYGKKAHARVIIGEKIYLQDLYDPMKTEQENINYLSEYIKNYIVFLGEKLNEIEKNKKN